MRLFSLDLRVFAVDADWVAVAPFPADLLLGCDVIAFPDVKLFNVRLMVLRNTGPTSRAVLRIAIIGPTPHGTRRWSMRRWPHPLRRAA